MLPPMDLGARVFRLTEFAELHLAEVRTAQAAAAREPTLAAWRLHARAVFTLIDGQLHMMRLCALDAQKGRLLRLSERELEVLHGSGRTSWTMRSLVIMHAFARAVRSPHRVDVASHGWADLEAAGDIRKRLVHPESTDDFALTQEEYALVTRAFHWFLETSAALLSTSSVD
jgi:hypothetical protein